MKKHIRLAAALLALTGSAALGAICGDSKPQPALEPAQQTTIAAAPTGVAGTATALSALEQKVASFDDFPILWLGTSFDSDGDGVGDMPLKGAFATHGTALLHPLTGAEISPAIDSFTLAYGDCEIAPGRDACNIPISIVFYPADSPIVRLSDSLRSGSPVSVRGVHASFGGGVLWMETADFVVNISVSAPGPDATLRIATRVANNLEGANAKAAGITKTSDFRPKAGAIGGSPTGGTPAPLASATPSPTIITGNVMSLDADVSAPGVQTTATILGGAAFPVEIDVTSVGATPYKAYQWEVEFESAGLAFAGNVQEHTTQTGLDSCTAPGASSLAPDPGFAIAGAGAGCLSLGQGPGTSYTGAVTTFGLRCLQHGTFKVLLIDLQRDPAWGSTLMDASGASVATKTQGITITCQAPPVGQPSTTP